MIDTLVKGGTIIDGTGNNAFSGDIAIEGDRIADVSGHIDANAKVTIDAKGKYICPGFVDIHSHADLSIYRDNHVDLLEPLVMQGITTFVGGNCGFSIAFAPEESRDRCVEYIEGITCQPLKEDVTWSKPADFMEMLERKGILLNMGLLVGHGSLRVTAAGSANRLLTGDEQARMEGYLRESLDMGCLGMSTGLQYFPGSQSDLAELTRLGKVLKEFNAIFTSHLRSYAHTLDNAIVEVAEVGRRAEIRVEISHLYWQPYVKGLAYVMRQAVRLGSYLYNNLHIPIPIEKGLQAKIDLIERQRADGVDVRFDMVPTSEGFTLLPAFLPPYVSEGGKEMMLERLKDRAFRRKVLKDIEDTEPTWPHRYGATWSFNYIKMTGWEGLRVMSVTKEENKWMEGKTFPDIARELSKDPIDAMCDLLIDEDARVLVFHTPLKPDDPLAFRSMWHGFTHPLSMVVTDTILIGVGRPAHVFYDCYPRFIKAFVKERKMLTIEEAVRKATGLPAEVMEIKERGVIKKGNFADIVVFDLDNLDTRADFYNPAVFPSGIEHVLINGRHVVNRGTLDKGILAGQMIRRAA